jgi:hypothetical protein
MSRRHLTPTEFDVMNEGDRNTEEIGNLLHRQAKL